MIVVDSSVWIAHLRGEISERTRKLEAASTADEVIVGDVVLLEVLQGARSERDAAILQRSLSAYPIEAMLDRNLAVQAAERYRMLRRRGITVKKVADLIIANFCVSRGHALLHADRDFDLIAEPLGLVVV